MRAYRADGFENEKGGTLSIEQMEKNVNESGTERPRYLILTTFRILEGWSTCESRDTGHVYGYDWSRSPTGSTKISDIGREIAHE